VTVCSTLRQPVCPAVQLSMLLEELIEHDSVAQLSSASSGGAQPQVLATNNDATFEGQLSFGGRYKSRVQ